MRQTAPAFGEQAVQRTRHVMGALLLATAMAPAANAQVLSIPTVGPTYANPNVIASPQQGTSGVGAVLGALATSRMGGKSIEGRTAAAVLGGLAGNALESSMIKAQQQSSARELQAQPQGVNPLPQTRQQYMGLQAQPIALPAQPLPAQADPVFSSRPMSAAMLAAHDRIFVQVAALRAVLAEVSEKRDEAQIEAMVLAPKPGAIITKGDSEVMRKYAQLSAQTDKVKEEYLRLHQTANNALVVGMKQGYNIDAQADRLAYITKGVELTTGSATREFLPPALPEKLFLEVGKEVESIRDKFAAPSQSAKDSHRGQKVSYDSLKDGASGALAERLIQNDSPRPT